MTCNQCGSELVCRLKDYGGNFAPSLQWQNFEGSAHYKTTDGKNFDCNIPDEDEASQTRIPDNNSENNTSAPGTITKEQFLILAHLEEKIDAILHKIHSQHEMVEAIFRFTVDQQLEKKK